MNGGPPNRSSWGARWMLGRLVFLSLVCAARPTSICEHTPSYSICAGTFTGTRLDLAGQGLTGTLPTELFQYTQLTSLLLRNNQISGTVPTEIGRLTRLNELILYNNQLSGTLPTELNLINRTYCYLTTTQCLAAHSASTCGGSANTNAFSCPVPTLPFS